MGFEKYMKYYKPEIIYATKEYYDMQTAWQAAQGEQVTLESSFYQSKRAKLKKQVTHWMGKFMICKAENNEIRKKNRMLGVLVEQLREESTQRQIQLDKLIIEVESIKQGVGV